MSPVDDEHLARIAERWQLRSSLRLLRDVENTVYDADADGVIVRVTDPERTPLDYIEAELSFMLHLLDCGIALARPRRSRHGERVAQIVSELDTVYVVVFEKIDGTTVSLDDPGLPALLEQWGEYLGRMHDATRSYRPHGARRPDWANERAFAQAVQAMRRNDDEPACRARFEELIEWANGLSRDSSEYGLIHADLHSGNFLVTADGRMVAFDFDDSQYGWFAYDLAVPLFMLLLQLSMRDDERTWTDVWSAMARGYGRAGGPPVPSEEQVWRFVELRAAVMFYWCESRLAANRFDERGIAWAARCMSYVRTLLAR